MNENLVVNGDNIDETSATNETAMEMPKLNLHDYTRAIELFNRLDIDVQYAGFNMLGTFTVIASEYFDEVEWGSMSVHVPAAILSSFYDKAIELLGKELIRKIAQVSKDGGQFSQHQDLNTEIPADEVITRINRLAKFMQKLGYEKNFYSFEWDRFECKFPKYYLDYMVRAILEGNTGVLKCASCTHATFLKGGFLLCDEKRMQEVDTSDGIPNRINNATAQRVWFGHIDTNIISEPEKMHDCWQYQQSTKAAAIKKAAENK